MSDILNQAQQLAEAKDSVKNAIELKAQLAAAPIPLTGSYSEVSDVLGYVKGGGDAADIKTAMKDSGIHTMGDGLVAVGAGAAMVGASGVGAGQGIAAGRAAEAVGRNPEAESKIRTIFILGVGIAESAAIYALIISILLLFVF